MATLQISATDLTTHLLAVLEQLKTGNDIEITKRGQPVALLTQTARTPCKKIS